MGLITECYLDITSTVAYIVLLVLGWKTQRFISNNTKVTNKKGSQKNVELNKQLNRTLIIQVIFFDFKTNFGHIILS